jgi:nicotinate phosphoribosyltransferase
MYDIEDPTRPRDIGERDSHEDLLVPVFRQGKAVYNAPKTGEIRERAQQQMARLDPRSKRFLNPQIYPVGLEKMVHQRKLRLIAQARGEVTGEVI